MTAATLTTLLDLTMTELERLEQRYESLRRIFEDSEPLKAQFAGLLSNREANTVQALTRYRSHGPHLDVLDVHVRLGHGFPFSGEGLDCPDNADLDELIELAEATDKALAQLSERVKVYAVSPGVLEALEAFEELIVDRRHQLSGAIRELEDHAPSPAQSHR